MPKNREDARKRHDWPKFEAAEREEIKRFMDMDYLVDFRKELDDKLKNVYIHTTRFVYQIKIFQDGTLDKYKVRFVFRGFTQIYFRDFIEIYAPVTQIGSIKLFFYCCLYYQLDHYVVDIKSAYLNADIDKELWCKLPEGFSVNGCKYARVNRAIPGVKQ